MILYREYSVIKAIYKIYINVIDKYNRVMPLGDFLGGDDVIS